MSLILDALRRKGSESSPKTPEERELEKTLAASRENARQIREDIKRATAALAAAERGEEIGNLPPMARTSGTQPGETVSDKPYKGPSVRMNLLGDNEVRKEIKKIPEADRETIGQKLSVIGFRVEKMKNDFFAAALDEKIIGRRAKIDKKGTVGRFCTELRNFFVRNAQAAEKKLEEVKSGKEKHRLSNAGLFFGNVLKYGRIVADVTGASIANPFRYVMMAGMVGATTSEAGKEARLKNEEVIEKTRFGKNDMKLEDNQFADEIARAQEEAFAIYDSAPKTMAEDGFVKVDAEALKNAYMKQMPEDLLKRLGDPEMACGFVQNEIRQQIGRSVEKLQKKIEDIEHKNAPGLDREKAKEKLLKKWEDDLKDYDRIVTQYGTVDELAMAGVYAQKISKGVVLGMQIETAIISVEKLFSTLSSVLASHDIHPLEATGKFISHAVGRPEAPTNAPVADTGAKVFTVDNPRGHDVRLPNEQHVFTLNADIPRPPGSTETGRIVRLPDEPGPRIVTQPPIAEHSAPVAPRVVPPEAILRNAVVHKNEGITQAFARQIRQNPKEFGYEGDVHDKHAMALFTKELAIKTGYMDNSGHEVRVAMPNRVAYELKMENGHPVVLEKTIDGKLLEIHHEGDILKTPEKHEYAYTKHMTSTENPNAPIPEVQPMSQIETQMQAPDDILQKEIFEKPLPETSETKEVLRAKLETAYSTDFTPGKGNIVPKGHGHSLEGKGNIGSLDPGNAPVHRLYEDNLHKIFPANNGPFSMARWTKDFSHRHVDNLLKGGTLETANSNPASPYSQVVFYVHQLQKATGLKPKGGFLGFGKEDVAHYMARALQVLKSKGEVEKGIFKIK